MKIKNVLYIGGHLVRCLPIDSQFFLCNRCAEEWSDQLVKSEYTYKFNSDGTDVKSCGTCGEDDPRWTLTITGGVEQ